MDSDEKKLGGGAGGGPHDDVRIVDGTFVRKVTQHIALFAMGADDGDTNNIRISAGNRGYSNGLLLMDAGANVVVATGDVQANSETFNGVAILVDDTQQILLTRGFPPTPESQYIILDENGITINAGDAATLTLAVGSNYIELSPTGVTIKGTLVQIN